MGPDTQYNRQERRRSSEYVMLAALLVALLSISRPPMPVEDCARPSPTPSQLAHVDLACMLGFGLRGPERRAAEARVLLARLIEATQPDNPELPELYTRQMMMLAEHGRTADWREVVQVGALIPLNRFALRDWALIHMAFARHHLGQFAAARRHLQEILKRHPSSRMTSSALLLLAESYLAEGASKHAKPHLIELTRRDNVYSAYARLVLGLLAEKSGQPKRAFGHYRTLLEGGVPGRSRARRSIQLAILARIERLAAR